MWLFASGAARARHAAGQVAARGGHRARRLPHGGARGAQAPYRAVPDSGRARGHAQAAAHPRRAPGPAPHAAPAQGVARGGAGRGLDGARGGVHGARRGGGGG
eukprot:8980239-Pyramimonas_sp.AAC.2